MGQMFDMETIDDTEIEKKPGRPQNPPQPVVIREVRSVGNRIIRIVEATRMVRFDDSSDANEEPDYWDDEY